MAAERLVGPLAGVGQPGGIAHRRCRGLWQGIAVGSVALTGWALGGGSEGLASAMVLWRFTGDRTWSATAEHRAQRGVAVSLADGPYLVAESIRHLAGEHRAETSVIGIGRRPSPCC